MTGVLSMIVLAVLRLVYLPGGVGGGRIFLSNTAEARKIATAAYRQQLAEAIAQRDRRLCDATGESGAGDETSGGMSRQAGANGF